MMRIDLRLDGCRSLKDKRRILRALIDRTRREFRVSIAEVGDHDLWNVACIGITCVSGESGMAESVLERVITEIESHPEVRLENLVREVERYP